MIFTLFKAICRKNRQIFPFYSPKLPILPRCLWKTVLCYILFTSHCVPSLADYSACLRRSLRPIASHPWPFSHRTPTMSKQVSTLELQNGCVCVIILWFMSQHVSTVSQHPRQQCECGQLFPWFDQFTSPLKHETDINRGPIVVQ